MRLLELDALRGLAALAIVLFHLLDRYQMLYGHSSILPSAAWGAYGVDLFFGISGFVIFMTLERARRPRDFLVSRFSRLYPAYWACILLTTAVVAIGFPMLKQPAGVVAWNFSMVQQFAGVPDVDGVYWTLAVELCFYAIMFLLYLLRLLPRIEWVLLAWLATSWLWWLEPGLSYTAGLLLVQQYIPFFVIGVCAYRIHAGQPPALPLGVIAAACLTVGVIRGSAELLVALVVVAALLACALRRAGWLRAAPLVWLGTISYTLYLLHENIGWTVIAQLERRQVPSGVAVLIAIVVVIGLAWVVTCCVERPAMRWIRRHFATQVVDTPISR